MSLKRIILLCTSIFTILTLYTIIQHEEKVSISESTDYLRKISQRLEEARLDIQETENSFLKSFQFNGNHSRINTLKPVIQPLIHNEMNKNDMRKNESNEYDENIERRGELKCNGRLVDSEVIYWKIVPGDDTYESPITPHHGIHHDRYLTYEYDEGGWNNIRMGMECLMVVAHAMGRTLVVPPKQHLYLLTKTHVGKDEMGFDDFFDINLLRSHKGFHVLSTEEFLRKEGVTGGLHGILPPKNRTDLWGRELHHYLRSVADEKPQWMGRFLAMPNSSTDLESFTQERFNELPVSVQTRLKAFGGERSPVFYGKELMEAHHIHFQTGPKHRLLQHHYAFAFFVDKEMQSFYRRFVRDYMRYKDEIQCVGDRVLREVRRDALAHNKGTSSDFYALHVRRGDFQFKEVKHSAAEIVQNLIVDGKSVIPPGSLVYLSTDDPKGVCENCMVQRIPCDKYEPGKKPVGCPEDPSWKAFADAGWTVRFLNDYSKTGALDNVNPNVYGMVESIVCSRAKVFAGTFFSTFTGYIHRLRGYHGLGEDTYYHSKGRVQHPRMKKSVGHGFSREWRAGWTDDGGELI